VCSEYWCDVVRLTDEGRERREEERKEKGNRNGLPSPRLCARTPFSSPLHKLRYRSTRRISHPAIHACSIDPDDKQPRDVHAHLRIQVVPLHHKVSSITAFGSRELVTGVKNFVSRSSARSSQCRSRNCETLHSSKQTYNSIKPQSNSLIYC
jgi:hypothetical protein